MEQVIAVLEMSLLMSLVSLAALLTFRFAGFPDLSVDGVFALGGVLLYRMIEIGLPLELALSIGVLGGALVGMTTGLISVKLNIHPLLASILILITLYSVNIRILGGANHSLLAITDVKSMQKIASYLIWIVPLTIFSIFIFLTKTELGIAYRATGNYPQFLLSIGRNVTFQRITLVTLASAFVATTGMIMTLKYSFADVSIGNGVVIAGIAALIVGEKLCSKYTYSYIVLAAPIGMLIYQSAVGIALYIGVNPIDVKLASAIIAIVLLASIRRERSNGPL